MASALVAMGVALVAAAYVPQLVALQAPEDAALQIPPSSTAWHAPAASVPSFDSLVPQVKFAAADSVLPAAAGRTFVLNF
jgi:hypothetical protein